MDSSHVTNGTIVVGIDGSDPSDLALAWATRQAELEHRSLTLVHASGPAHPIWLGPPAIDFDDLRSSLSAHARATMNDAVSWVHTHHPDVAVQQVLSEDDPRQELLARAPGAAMMVVGSRGRGPVRTLLLGSVGVAVSSHATCPVVVLRPDDGDHPRDQPLRGVLVGVQGAAVSRPTLEFAFRLASSRALPLTVLQCFWDARLDSNGPADIDPADLAPGQVAHEAGRTLLGDVLAATSPSFPDVEVTLRLQHGFLDRRLIDLSSSMDAVVLGSDHPHLLRRATYGSLARMVVEHARGVVVVVPLTDHA